MQDQYKYKKYASSLEAESGKLKADSGRFRGMTLIEAVVAIGILVVAVVGLIDLFRVSVRYVETAAAREDALSLAVERMEQLRALPYGMVGTQSGIPSGTIAQNETVMQDTVSFNRRTFIEYHDDPADGLGVSDTNGISTDYKIAKVAVSWLTSSGTSTVSLISNFIPQGVESNVSGGILSLSVINAAAQPLVNAAVQIVNSGTTPPVNVTAYSNASGLVFLPGTPPAGGYQITVSEPGYSTAQTYTAAGQNVNPNPGNLTVVSNQTTSAAFAIDQLASFLLRTWTPIQAATTTDLLGDMSGIASSTQATVSGGTLALATVSGHYASAGSAYENAIAPAQLSQWTSLSWNQSVPASTSLAVHLYLPDGSGGFTLLPDSALPGNSAGFSTSPVSLSAISTSTYPSLVIGGTLATSNTSQTPQVLDWSLSYNQGPTPLPNIPFTLQGTKTIGTNNAGASIYKFSQSLTTNSAGQYAVPLEWDTYTASVASTTGWDTSSACPLPPLSISPGSTVADDIYLVAHTATTLMVAVHSAATGAPLPNASVTLSRSGFSATQTADLCGNAFFPSLSSATYSYTASSAGYTPKTVNNVSVSGQTASLVSL